MQRELAARLAELAELETISFRHFDGIVLSRGDVLKLFMPRSRRTLLGTPKDQTISGDILAIFAEAIKPMKPPSKRFDYTELIFGASIANFPGLVMYREDGRFVEAEDFLKNLNVLASFLPDSTSGWRENFGTGFFEKSLSERISIGIGFLRKSVDFKSLTPDFADFVISIEDN